MATWPKILLPVMENYVGWFLASVSQIEIGPNLIIDNRTVHAAYFVS